MAQAQTSPSASSQEEKVTALEEVFVTARRFTENLQQSPIPVSVFTSKDLEARDVKTLVDVANIAPNVNFGIGGDAAGSNSNAIVFIRGIGQKDFSPSVDPGVGIYIDGVYLARTIGGVLDTADAAQVEVLRGPQGTVFGRNSLGGAVVLTTPDPSDKFEGHVTTTVGELDRNEILASFDVPFSDTLKTHFSGLYKKRRGFVEAGNNQDLNDVDSKGGRVKVLWTPTDKLRVTWSADADFQNKHGGGEVAVFVPLGGITNGPYNTNALLSLRDPQGNPYPVRGATNANGTPDTACALNGGPLTDPNCVNGQYALGPFRSAETAPRFDNLEAWGVNGTEEYKLSDNVTLKAITSYREVHDSFTRAEDGTPLPLLFNLNELNDYSFSQEGQVISTLFDNRLTTVSGIYYFREQGANHQYTQFYRNDLIPNFLGGSVYSWNAAGYTESTLKLAEHFRWLLGVRYTHERRAFAAISRRANSPLFYRGGPGFPAVPGDPNFAFIAANSGAAIPPVAYSPAFDQNFLSGSALLPAVTTINKPTWRVGPEYDLTDHLTTYFTASRGFKSGGFDIRVTSPASRIPSFGPEYVTDYEFGLKSEFPDLGLRVNTNFFWMNYTSIQIVGVAPGTINTATFNGGDGVVKGVELEWVYAPNADLAITGTFGYENAYYTSIVPGAFITLQDHFVRTPEQSADLNISYHLYKGSYGDLTPRISANYKSTEEFQAANVSVNEQIEHSRAHVVLDGSVAYRPPSVDNLIVTAGVNNFTNKIYAEQGDGNLGLGLDLLGYAQPRNWYLTVSEKF